MKQITINTYEFIELSEEAKGRARDWYRQGALDEWWERIFEDAARVGLRITSFDTDRNRHATGEFMVFGGAEQVAGLILSEHGPACETRKASEKYLSDFKSLNAEIEAVDGDDETNADWETWQDKRGELQSEYLKSLLEDYSIMLQNEREYLNSDESVDESIIANDYTFTATGKREG